jgi:hypothetical protein
MRLRYNCFWIYKKIKDIESLGKVKSIFLVLFIRLAVLIFYRHNVTFVFPNEKVVKHKRRYCKKPFFIQMGSEKIKMFVDHMVLKLSDCCCVRKC